MCPPAAAAATAPAAPPTPAAASAPAAAAAASAAAAPADAVAAEFNMYVPKKNCLSRNQRKILLPYTWNQEELYILTNCGTILNDTRDDVTISTGLDRGLGGNSMSRELN